MPQLPHKDPKPPNIISFLDYASASYSYSVNMTDSGRPSPTPDTESSFETTIVSSLAVYTKSSEKKAKEVKTVKVKEFDFTISEDNYLNFLRELLQSQSQDKYQVAAKKRYRFKYLYPLSKVYVIVMIRCTGADSNYRLHNAVDVDNKKDYKQMVTNVLEQQLKKIKILVGMKDVQQSCPILASGICFSPGLN